MGTVVDDAPRLLARASELIDSKARASFVLNKATDLPTDPAVAAACRDACCAQVEFWLEVGEEHDIAGMANRGAAIGHLRLDALPPELGPRARRILSAAGLFTASLVDSSWGPW